MLLEVGDGHTLYYKEYGNPNGKPVVVLHGGPGGGHQRAVLKYFDLKRWRVILYDQRGCGLSTPRLSLHKNTTWDLVKDLEKLRAACSIERWTVFGGSWGSTLALAYASKHLNHVAALVLRGICLLEPWETDWLYKEGGASRLYPEAWASFAKAAGSKKGNLTRTYSRLLRGRQTRKKAAAAWWGWEAKLSQLRPTPDRSTPKQVEELAVLENHYFLHNGWLRPGQLLAAAAKIPKSVPVYIVQGRYDLVCPAASAIALASVIPHANLTLTIAGHAGSEPENAKALREATDALAKATRQ
jgi:proline iminopeptidase